jgi:uncharacterized protein YukE
MSTRLIDYGRAEAAIRALNEYSQHLSEVATALKLRRDEIRQYWQGESFGQFSTDIDFVLRLVSQAEIDSRRASQLIAQGLQKAIADEREAALRALQGQ